MAELADATDSKSVDLTIIRVRPPFWVCISKALECNVQELSFCPNMFEHAPTLRPPAAQRDKGESSANPPPHRKFTPFFATPACLRNTWQKQRDARRFSTPPRPAVRWISKWEQVGFLQYPRALRTQKNLSEIRKVFVKTVC